MLDGKSIDCAPTGAAFLVSKRYGFDMLFPASLRTWLRDRTPSSMRLLSREISANLGNRRNRRLRAREVFTRVYAEQMWGSGPGDFYSGPGSDPEAAQPYADFVTDFIARNGIRSVVDLGCGDFRVGRMIISDSVSYTGVDVVEPLIEDNIRRYGSGTIRFECLDISADRLPDADLCLVREVFQHLSNAEISATLSKLRQYDYVLFTDVQPEIEDDYKINRDKVHGASSRILHKSFLRLDAPPFSVKHVELVFETSPPGFRSIPPYDHGFKLRTFLIRRTPSVQNMPRSAAA